MARIAMLGVLVALALPAQAAPGDTDLVSVNRTGNGTGNSDSHNADLSDDARYVTFESEATDLVANDTNGVADVFVRDRQTGTTERVSVSSGGAQANGRSANARITPDGRYVAFISFASNLVPNDTNGTVDGFVRDRLTGITERVTFGPQGQQPDGGGGLCGISADGRYVGLALRGTNMGSGAYAESQFYVRDRQAGTTTLASLSTDGLVSNGWNGSCTLSADGRFLAFSSDATNLVPNDTNDELDVFLRDLKNGTTERVSLGVDGGQFNQNSDFPSLSADGHYVAFQTLLTREIYVRDAWAGTTKNASLALDGTRTTGSETPAMSADGRYVVFSSAAKNLVPRDPNDTTDIFRRDLVAATTELMSLSTNGTPTNGLSYRARISADGRYVVFDTVATNLGANDLNGSYEDVYLHEAGGAVSQVAFTVKPAELDFGPQAVGTRRTLSFWLRNKGTRDIVILDGWQQHFQLRGVNAAQFSLRTRCGTVIAVGTSCPITVTFAPTSTGTKYARVRVAIEDVVRTRPVTGTGVPAP